MDDVSVLLFLAIEEDDKLLLLCVELLDNGKVYSSLVPRPMIPDQRIDFDTIEDVTFKLDDLFL